MFDAIRRRVSGAIEPFSNLIETGANPYGLIERLYRERGDLFELRLMGLPPVRVCADPEGIRQLVSGSYEQMSRFAGGVELFVDRLALILFDDEPHKKRRKLMGPPFHAEAVRAFGPEMSTITDAVLDRLPLGAPFPLLDAMQDITMRVILRCVFGVAEGPRLEELRVLVIEYLRLAFGPDMLSIGATLSPRRAHELVLSLSRRTHAAGAQAPFTPSRLPVWRMADRLGRIHALLDAEIERCFAEGPERRNDVLAMLLRLRFDDGEPMSREELLAQLLMLLIGGYETTSMSLCWAVYCLLRSPEALARVRAEIAAVMPGGFDQSRVRDLNYLGAAIAESMRLYPIAIGVSRRLRQPMRIGDREIAAGETVMASIYLVQRDPKLWPDPERFAPERMLERRPPPYLHFPFGAGVWRCLGAAFAEHEMRIVLARLFTRFDLRPDPGVEVKPQQRGITVGPSHGLPVIASPRSS